MITRYLSFSFVLICSTWFIPAVYSQEPQASTKGEAVQQLDFPAMFDRLIKAIEGSKQVQGVPASEASNKTDAVEKAVDVVSSKWKDLVERLETREALQATRIA